MPWGGRRPLRIPFRTSKQAPDWRTTVQVSLRGVLAWWEFRLPMAGNADLAQFFEAAAAAGPDASDRDAQPGAYLRIRHRRVLDEHAHQLLAFRRQVRESLAQRRVALRHPQFMVDHPGLRVRDNLDFQHMPERLRAARRAPGPAAFPLGGGGQPARKCGRIGNCRKFVHKLQPYSLEDVVIAVAKPVSAAD